MPAREGGEKGLECRPGDWAVAVGGGDTGECYTERLYATTSPYGGDSRAVQRGGMHVHDMRARAHESASGVSVPSSLRLPSERPASGSDPGAAWRTDPRELFGAGEEEVGVALERGGDGDDERGVEEDRRRDPRQRRDLRERRRLKRRRRHCVVRRALRET